MSIHNQYLTHMFSTTIALHIHTDTNNNIKILQIRRRYKRYTSIFFKQNLLYTNFYSRAGNSHECFLIIANVSLAANQSLSYYSYNKIDLDKDSSQTSFMEVNYKIKSLRIEQMFTVCIIMLFVVFNTIFNDYVVLE